MANEHVTVAISMIVLVGSHAESKRNSAVVRTANSTSTSLKLLPSHYILQAVIALVSRDPH